MGGNGTSNTQEEVVVVMIGNTTHSHDTAHLSESPKGKQEDRVGISPRLHRRRGCLESERFWVELELGPHPPTAGFAGG